MPGSKNGLYVAGFCTLAIAFGLLAYGIHNTSDDGTSAGQSSSGQAALSSKLENGKRPLELKDATQKTSQLKEEVSVAMNDPAIAQAWGIDKVGAQQAWKLTRGNKNIVVAVIDTGCDIHHEDLAANIWKNPGESGKDSQGRDKSNNGIDDDGNGFIDDVHGWNFVSSNNDLTDNHGHGTHISGIIGAEAGNGKGIAGIAPDVSIMCLKYFDPKVPNTDNLRNTIRSIQYATAMHASIINYSGGGTEYSQDEKDAIDNARKNGILFVAAAGNERSNSDVHHYYPADYGLPNIISVTAIDPNIQVLPSSNYGTSTVDIAAPGQNILSLLPNNAYGTMTGTSQATAFVTGAAVLVMAHRGLHDPELVKKYIISTGDAETQLLNKTATYRKLNLYTAVVKQDQGVSANGTRSDSSQSFQSAPTQEGLSGQMKFGNDLRGAIEKQLRSANKPDGT
jgi:subtilisin family serine protease